MKLQALIYVTAMETGKRILGYFHSTGIKQMLNQELDGKIYVMKDREAIFFIALSNLILLARMYTLEQPHSL